MQVKLEYGRLNSFRLFLIRTLLTYISKAISLAVPSAFCSVLFCWGIWKSSISVKIPVFPGYLKHYLYDTNDHFPCTPTSVCMRILALYWLRSFWCMGNSALFVQDLAQWGCGPSLWLLSASAIQIMLSPLKNRFVKCKHVWSWWEWKQKYKQATNITIIF